MSVLTGTYETKNAAKFMAQLCKHFGHKTETSFDETSGMIMLAVGKVDLVASPEQLKITIALQEADQAARAKNIIDKHLVRFAFREGFEEMTWEA